MGILNGSKALFSLNGLSLNHVTEIAKKMAEVNGRAGGHPRICIDASWLERKARNRCAEIIGILKEDGFAITVVFDPPSRHHWKVVSISRCGKRENARLDYYAARFQAKLVSEELSKGSLSNDERAELEKELEKLHSKARTKEHASVSSLVRPSFVEDLKEQITKLPPSRFGSEVSCTTGSYQADSVISQLVEKGECDLVFSSDSDFSFVGGTKCVQLVDFKLTKGKLAKISIKTATRGTMDQAVNAANSLQSPRTLMSCVEAEFPILDEVDDPRLRCAIAVIQVRERTGFKSLALLLSYIAVICNGKISDMTNRQSYLSWFEEWFLDFQWVWGREATRMTSLARAFDTSHATVRRILRVKLAQIKAAMGTWPRFVSLEEDRTLMKSQWRKRYDDMRVIFWDKTNIDVPASSDPNINRHTYSHYYNGTVAKGARCCLPTTLWLDGHLGTFRGSHIR